MNKSIKDIENYSVQNSSHVYQKQLYGFLFKDTLAEKEALFEALEPLIVVFRADKNNVETLQERKFLIAYKAMLLKSEHYRDVKYRLDPQKEIEGSIAYVKPYRADFLNKESKLIVEINGSVHDTDEARKYDRERNRKLTELGYVVYNFTNDEIERKAYKCAYEVIKAIEKRLNREDDKAHWEYD